MENTLESFVDMLEENTNADYVVTESGKTILLVKRVEESIKAQVKEPGEGSIFIKAWKLKELKSSLQKIQPEEAKSLYEGELSGAGFNLVKKRKDVVPYMKLIGVDESKILIEAQTRRVINIPVPIEKFKTNVITYSLRTVGVDEATNNFTEFEDTARTGKLFILEDVTIGPHLAKWDDDLFIIVPNK